MASSNPPTFLGMEAMNNGYFMAGNIIGGGGGMTSADVTPFHPSMLLEHGGSVGFGFGGAAVTVAELGTQFAATNAMLASFANHLSATARPQEEEESLQHCPGQSGDMAVWSSSSKTPYPYGGWSSASDAAGFHYPLLACGGGGGPTAPATSELSLTLCSKSSPDSALNAADQCSSVASRSALTEARSTPPAAAFAAVVARSRYAAAAQEVLNDIVGRLLDGVADDATDSGSGIDASSSVVSSNWVMASPEDGGDAGARWGQAAQRARTDLINLLQLLDQKYNQCLDEILSTTAKFNGLMQQGSSGIGNASICAPFAHRAVAAMYRGLRRRIAGEIMGAAACRPACWGESSSATAGDVERSWESALIQKHWAMQKARRGEQQCWRPQRGLPERSVAVLKGWMFEHFLKPYPDDHAKDMLAARSGLTRNQVSNWFINARVRIWKPMIEEMYQDLKKSSAGEQGMEMEPQRNTSTAMLSA